MDFLFSHSAYEGFKNFIANVHRNPVAFIASEIFAGLHFQNNFGTFKTRPNND
jgi:hypothetical protein